VRAIIAGMHTPLHTISRTGPRAVITAAMLCIAVVAHADPDAEREVLARLIHEIRALEPLIVTAESQALPDTRIRFRYDWLRRDLRRIRDGIQDHIDAPRNEPRRFPPLRGDYRQ
jgi:RAQPRD family integrative conjugative element protein